MQIIINLPDNVKQKCAEMGLSRLEKDDMDAVAVAIAHGIQLPDNATNGDIIDVIFQSVDFFQDGAWMQMFFDNMTYSFCPVKWWNAPYKAGKRGNK